MERLNKNCKNPVDGDIGAPTYEIYTFNDLLKVPSDRLPILLDEFKNMIMASKIIYDMHSLLGKSINKDVIQLPFKWIDDDKGNINLKIETNLIKPKIKGET